MLVFRFTLPRSETLGLSGRRIPGFGSANTLTARHHRCWRSSLLAFAAVWAVGGAEVVAQGSAAADRAALEAFYDATGGAGWTDSTNWKTSAPLGEWYGVKTDAAGRVAELALHGNALTGAIPAALGDLAFLQHLDLGYRWDPELRRATTNSLTGPIPARLGELTRLRVLYLGGNALDGLIPEALGRLDNLVALLLDGCGLSGPIPESLGDLESLQSLNLNNNKLTGPIPESLGGLENLRTLDLRRNELSGRIPTALAGLNNLRTLYLDNNALTGPIPKSLGNLENLETLYLRVNALTGPIPDSLGSLENLEILDLRQNDLTGPIPDSLGSLERLETLDLRLNDLTGPIPAQLEDLAQLRELYLAYNWGLSGSLPPGLRLPRLRRLDFFMTQACAPYAMTDWLDTIEFNGRLCELGRNATIDLAVVYTSSAREAAGGAASLAALIDLYVAVTNEAFALSDVDSRVALVDRYEVSYAETGNSRLDVSRLADPADGHMDGVHARRDRSGADVVFLVVGEADVCGIALTPGPFGVVHSRCDGAVLAHEFGHSLGLRHDRYQVDLNERGVTADPAYGYLNQRAFEPGAPPSSRWRTLMAYVTQCRDNDIVCPLLPRYSNPRQRYNGGPLGIAYGAGGPGVTMGPADAAAVLNATGPAAALWRDRMPGGNRPPTTARILPDRRLPALRSVLEVDVSRAFVDPDRDRLRYTVSTAAPEVAAVRAAGSRVTLTAVGLGASAIRVTATDTGGLSVTQSFMVTVADAGTTAVPFTDHPLVPGVTRVREVHFTELRLRIDALRDAAGLAPFAWTDRVLIAGVTPVQLVHLLELRSALDAAYVASGRATPSYTDAAPAAGATAIRAVHLMELRAAVVALE